MVDLKIVREKGCTPENLQKWLSGNPLAWSLAPAPTPGQPNVLPEDNKDNDAIDKRRAMWNRIRSRIQEGMNRNFRDYRLYYALDTAWNTPFRQITPTILQAFMDRNPSEDEVQKQLDDWGMSHMLTQEIDARTGQPTGKKILNLPIFYNVFVPLVRAYVIIRWAKIMNDRLQTPFFKYEPAKVTTPGRLRCEVITDRVQVMSKQYGYYDVVKQSVLKMLHYGWTLQFPVEEWHSETQWKYADAVDALTGKLTPDGKPCAEGELIKETVKEGIRYHTPHPTRTYRDFNHGAYTYNYDSGCEYAGYWQIRRYRDLLASNFWNADAISIGPNSLMIDHALFFQSVYPACTLVMPQLPKSDPNTTAAQVGAGVENLDREKSLAYLYYGVDHYDQGVMVTEHFEKLIPKDNGLGDYDFPIWFRFVIAGDNCTFLYATPLPYCPIIYYGYDANESQTNNASLSLECLPFQDQFSNVLTQILLTAKQNLANITMIDGDVLDDSQIKTIANIGERLVQKLNIFTFSGKKAIRAQNKMPEVVQSHALPRGNTAELINVLKTILDVLERVLVMSSHEVAQAASHEQTREEVKNIAASTSTRLQFTATPVDIAGETMKRQLYEGLMAYGDDDVYAHLPSELPLTTDVLEAMGFTAVDKNGTKFGPNERHMRIRTSKQKTAINIWELASSRSDMDRSNDAAMAQTLAALARDLMANPLTAQAVGADQAIALANQIAQYSGLPRDFKLRNISPNQTPEQQQAEAQAQLQQVSQMVLQQVNQQLQADLKPLMDKTMANSKDIALIVRAMGINAPNPANDTSPQAVPAGGPN